MVKKSELEMELSKLKRCGEELIGISETLKEMISGMEAEAEPIPEAKEEKKSAEKATETEEKKPMNKTEEKEVTLEDVRSILVEKSRQGHTTKVKELLAKYGANKLCMVDVSKYAELKAEAEVLGDD